MRKIFKEIRMSKNKTLFLRDDVKDFKKNTDNYTANFI